VRQTRFVARAAFYDPGTVIDHRATAAKTLNEFYACQHAINACESHAGIIEGFVQALLLLYLLRYCGFFCVPKMRQAHAGMRKIHYRIGRAAIYHRRHRPQLCGAQLSM